MEPLEQLKSSLRSLVVSSPAQVDAAALARDYRVMMGEHVPTARYGYRDLVTFLREKCADCFLFSGPSGNPVLTLIVPDTMKHIDGFVQKQKIPSSAKFKGKRRSVPESMMRPKETCQTSNGNGVIAQKSKYPPPTTTYKPPSSKISNSPSSIQNNGNLLGANSARNITQSITNLNIQTEEDNQSIVSTSGGQTDVQNFLHKKLHGSTQHFDSESKDDDSGRHTLSSGGLSSKQALLSDLRLEMKVLIAEHPHGIWSADLMRLYSGRFGRELPLARLGYSNVVSLTRALVGVVSLARPLRTGDWLLLAPGAAPPPASAPAPATAPAPAAAQADPDDALPGVPFEAAVFPADCLHFVESIPVAPALDVAPGGTLHVMVGEVYSPSHLWLLQIGPDLTAMEDIMDEMNQYYGAGAGRARVLEAGAVRAGHYCACPFEGDWHRALIVKLLDDHTVKVRYVDYGTVGRVRRSALRPLRRQWGALPAAARRARLAGVRPVRDTPLWPPDAARCLLRLVAQRPLVAQLVAQDKQEGILEVFLVDTSGAEDVCVNDELVAAGHADPRADCALASGDPHLLPSFEALEGGWTPNLDEIEQFLAAGLQPRYLRDYRRHVLPAPAGPPPPDHVWLPALDLQVYRELAALAPDVAARHLAASLARAGAGGAGAGGGGAGAVAVRRVEAERAVRLVEADPRSPAARRYLSALLPPPPPPPPHATPATALT